MIPVGGRPVIHWTIDYLLSLGLTKYVIAVPTRGLFVEEYVACAFGDRADVDFIVPDRDGGVGYTLHCLAQAATTERAMVVLGDTFFRFDDPSVVDQPHAVVLTSAVDDSYRWCVAQSDQDGVLVELKDKVDGLPAPQDALIGVYLFDDAKRLQCAAAACVADAEKEGRRAELRCILEAVHAEEPIRCARAGDWLDCGNADRQAASHRALLQARTFNELEVDEVLGTITKRSANRAKFIDEIEYLKLLPDDLKVLFPRVVAQSTSWDAPYLTMEYYGYPSLADVFVYENVDPGIWEKVFRHLKTILVDGFARHARPLHKGDVAQMLLHKSKARHAELMRTLDATSPYRSLFDADQSIRVNGVELKTLPALWGRIGAMAEQLDENARGAVVHGDMCFSNVLYDLRNRIVKLIDPRGSFGTTGVYGDQRYDVAKLYHSVYGAYDLVVNDLFAVKVEGADVQLDIRHQPRHAAICQRFEDVFFPAYDRQEILFVTAMLFASMPALHYEAPARQAAMYVRSLQLLNEIWG